MQTKTGWLLPSRMVPTHIAIVATSLIASCGSEQPNRSNLDRSGTPYSNTAKHGDCIVFGSIIALCEGADSEIALRNCNQFADALR